MNTRRMKSQWAYWMERFRERARKRTFYLFLLCTLLAVIFLGSLLTLFFERGSNPTISTYGDALWLSFVTMTTVGYGDTYPITAGGRAVGIVSMVLGISILSIFISARAALRVDESRRRSKGLEKKVRSQDHFVVCGWNKRGRYVLSRLKAELQKEHTQIILLCDLEEKPIDDEYIFFVRGSQVNDKDLERANVGGARAVILLADDTKGGDNGEIDAKTVLAALTIRSINPDIKMTAEVLEATNIHHLELAGVGEISDSNLVIGNLMARSALHYGLISTVSELITRERGEEIYRIPVNEKMAGMSREQLLSHLEQEYGSNLLAIRSGGVMRTYQAVHKVSPGDMLIVLSEEEPPGALK